LQARAKVSEKIKALLEIIQSEDCFNYLKQVVEGEEENCRMNLLKENNEAQLLFKSGLGPFFVAERFEVTNLNTEIHELSIMPVCFFLFLFSYVLD